MRAFRKRSHRHDAGMESVGGSYPLGRGCPRLRADCGPGHFVDPDQGYIEKPLLPHHALDRLARPIVRDLRQHLIKHDRSQMPKAEAPQKPKIGDATEPETQEQPQNRGRIESEMMHEPDRKP